jgi:L-lactate dehydrogenase complex protein LldE
MKAQLFITCLNEQFFPGVLEKMVALLERVGVEPVFPPEQTCCGQAFFNGGFQNEARKIASGWLRTFGRSDLPVVSPSGSCVDMVHHHYPDLFPEGTPEHALAKDLAGRTYEFTQFLVNVLHVTDLGACYPHRVTYHASCHLLRGLRAEHEPKELLRQVRGLELVQLADEQVCCGFGGVFSVVYPPVSQAMMESKLRNIQASGAEAVVACDAGCLMNIAGGLHKAGSPVKALHIIDVLASQEGGTH